jgi:prepilin-type N-terminal cleavage/methylation domain-containing protein
MVKRGFSLVELLFVVAVSTLVMGVTVSLYGYSMTRLAQGAARFSTENQACMLLDEIDMVVQDSVAVAVIGTANGPALRCTLAQTSAKVAEADGSGSDAARSKTAEPISTTKRGFAKHGIGKRVWFYRAGSTGTFGSVGTYVWRAERNDDSNPTPADLTNNWSGYYGTTQQRFPLVTGMTFTVDLTNCIVNATVTSRSLWRDERTGDTGDRASQTFTESRSIGWRHWFR